MYNEHINKHDDAAETMPENTAVISEAAAEVTAEVAKDAATAAKDICKDNVKGEKPIVKLSTEPEDGKPELVIELSKSYDADGEIINTIDISGIEDISQAQQEKVDKLYRKIAKTTSVTPEFTPDYAVAMAHVLTDIPVEIIKQFAFKDKIRIKNAIMGFLYGDD